jgi:hypothetical protein
MTRTRAALIAWPASPALARARASATSLAIALSLALGGCAPEPPESAALVGELRERSLALAQRAPAAAALDYLQQLNEALGSMHDRETAALHRWQLSRVADRMREFMIAADDPRNRVLPSPDALESATRSFEQHLARLEHEAEALEQIRSPLFEIVLHLRAGAS